MNAAEVFGMLFVLCFVYLMGSAYVLRWMIDGAKVAAEGPKLFRSITPPRRILTPIGVRVWWSRLFALALGLTFLGCSFYFR